MALLSPQQQKIVNFLCEHRQPATVTLIARNCFATQQTISGQLKQLSVRRYVRVDRIGRESFYELTEPLLRICVEAKTHLEQPLNLLVDFVRYWFSRDELQSKLAHSTEREYDRLYFLAALKQYDIIEEHSHLSPAIESLCLGLGRPGQTREMRRDAALEMAQLSRVAEDWQHYARAMQILEQNSEALPILERVLERHPEDVGILRWFAILNFGCGSRELGLKLNERATRLSPTHGMLHLDRGLMQIGVGQYQEAIDSFREAVVQRPDLKRVTVVHEAHALLHLKRFESVRHQLSPFLEQGTRLEGIFHFFGAALFEEDRFEEALPYFKKALDAFPFDSFSQGFLGLRYAN